jgi:predicted amidohydrolase YtcJ
MTSTLYRNGHIVGTEPRATAMLVTDATVTWLGTDDAAPTADSTVDLDGALVAPAFVDAHVHTTGTGLMLAGLNLSAVRSAAELLDAVAAYTAGLPADAMVLGHGWDESTWVDQRPPDAGELDRAGGGRAVYLTQASVHSCLCSSALLAAGSAAVDKQGYDPSGWLREAAHHVVREIALGSVSTAQRRSAQTAALRAAAALGIAAVHECGGPNTSDESDFTALLALSGQGLPEVYGYWGELGAAAKAKELGAVGAGGDLYADGALGSQTAHLSTSYLDSPDGTCGYGFVTAEEVTEHIVDCVRHGMQGGFHAIGDAAITTVVAGFAAAAKRVGLDRLREGRHRIEHAEIMNKALIKAFVEYGIVASMQPAFDRLWGGEHQMYAQRLGVEVSLQSNPMGALHGVGVAMAFGSDSPVTPLDPWGSVRAAVWHHNPAHRMSTRAAFAAHTRGGWRAVHRDNEGELAPGHPATFAAWDTPAGLGADGLPDMASDAPLPRCRMTVLRGQTIYEAEPE